MEKVDKLADSENWFKYVGIEVIKHSGKPFKGGKHTALVVELTTNPHSGKKAFKLNNDSIVDCYQCKPLIR